MAIATKTINGKVVTPDGVGWAGGTIYYSLNVPGTVDDAGTEQVIDANKVTIIQSDGTVDFKMIPNDSITPADTVYVIRFFAPDGSRMIQHWRVLTTDPATINIGDVTRVVSDDGGYISGTLAGHSDTDVAGAINDDVLTWDSVTEKWTAKVGGAGGADPAAIHDDQANEFTGVPTEKTALVSADKFLIEDSEAGGSKKYVQVANLPGGGAQTEYTTATRPSLVVGNKNTPYVVKDSGEHAHGEIIYETDAGGVYAYHVTWQPF